MKRFIREVKPYVKLYIDDKTGIAWIEDGSTGLGISVHPNIDTSGSVRGMRDRGYWGKYDRAIKSHGWIYNVDRFIRGKDDELESIVANECMCPGCRGRREYSGQHSICPSN